MSRRTVRADHMWSLEPDELGDAPAAAPPKATFLPAVTDRLMRPTYRCDRPKPLGADYDKPITDREGWWRQTIRDTPFAGHYDTDSFVDVVASRPATYGFKSSGRTRDVWGSPGHYLLPGGSNFDSLYERLCKQTVRPTYGFKSSDSRMRDTLNDGLRDRQIDVSPSQYNAHTHLSIDAQKFGARHAAFKSTSRRVTFEGRKDGPGPGQYDVKVPPGLHLSISACFKSSTPRFSGVHTKTPGPGTYDRTVQWPKQSKPIQQMGQQYGLYFSPNFVVSNA